MVFNCAYAVAVTNENAAVNWHGANRSAQEPMSRARVTLDALAALGFLCMLKAAPPLQLGRKLRHILGEGRPEDSWVDAVIDVGNRARLARMSSHGTLGIAART